MAGFTSSGLSPGEQVVRHVRPIIQLYAQALAVRHFAPDAIRIRAVLVQIHERALKDLLVSGVLIVFYSIEGSSCER